MATASHDFHGSLGVTRTFSAWNIVSAVLLIILGMFAIAEPAVAGLGVTLLVALSLLLRGVCLLIAAFKGGGAKQVIFQILIGVAYLAGGIYFLTHPLLAIGTLTLVLAGVILATGVLEIMTFFGLR